MHNNFTTSKTCNYNILKMPEICLQTTLWVMHRVKLDMRFPAVSVIKYLTVYFIHMTHMSHMRNINSTSSNFRPCLLTDQLTLTI